MQSKTPHAYVTFLILNDSYLPGALLQAFALREQDPNTDRICLVTSSISAAVRSVLHLLFTFVVPVNDLYVPRIKAQEAGGAGDDSRGDLAWLFTRLNALRLGPDGDLGFCYKKIVLLDADILPLKHYHHLFLLEGPAGIINERKEHFVDCDSEGCHRIPALVEIRGRWRWHEVYRTVGHGDRIPQDLTDRVVNDPENMGVNTALLVLEPSIADYVAILEELGNEEIARLIATTFSWPDMQYLTKYWSGRWSNIDVCFCGINGYPKLSCLFGVHFSGIKPWDVRRWKSVKHYARFDDFRYWYSEFLRMIQALPSIRTSSRIAQLEKKIRELKVPLAV